MADWQAWLKQITNKDSPTRRVVGVILIVLGLLALVTPLTPGSWLIFVGLELVGIRLAVWDRIKFHTKFSSLLSLPKRSYAIILCLLILLAIAGIYFYSQFAPAKEVSFGLIFSPSNAIALGLDPQEVYANMLADLKPQKVITAGQNLDNKMIIMRQVFYSPLVGYYKYPGSLLRYRIEAGILEVFGHKALIRGELQAEPVNFKADLDTQKTLMNPKVFQNNIEFAKKVGFSETYLGGVEWWYWMAIKQGDFGMWTAAKDLLAGK